MSCPACEFTHTEYRAFATRDKNWGAESVANSRADKFTCLAAKNQKTAIPCLQCPICEKDTRLQTAIMHRCEREELADIAIKPGTKCPLCDFHPKCTCKCALCNVEAHANEFFIVANPIPPPTPCGVKTWPIYPSNQLDDNQYAALKRSEYVKKFRRTR